MHILSHLAADCKRFGSADSISCFPFENALKSVKSFYKPNRYPLVSVANKLKINNSIESRGRIGAYGESRLFKKAFHVNGFIVQPDAKNCFFGDNQGRVFKMVSKCGDDALAQQFMEVDSAFYCQLGGGYRFPSKDAGIAELSGLSDEIVKVPSTLIARKYICHEVNGILFAYKLLN